MAFYRVKSQLQRNRKSESPPDIVFYVCFYMSKFRLLQRLDDVSHRLAVFENMKMHIRRFEQLFT